MKPVEPKKYSVDRRRARQFYCTLARQTKNRMSFRQRPILTSTEKRKIRSAADSRVRTYHYSLCSFCNKNNEKTALRT